MLVAVLLVVAARGADACPPRDLTFVIGPGGGLDEETPTQVPPNPTVYVHLGRHSPAGMPTFTRPDGSVVPHRVVESIELGWEGEALRVDLQIDAGDVIVRVPKTKYLGRVPVWPLADPWLGDVYGTAERIAGTLRVGAFEASEAAIERHGEDLFIESNATLYRLERFDGTPAEHDISGARAPADGPFRVVAVYADRTEEVVHLRWSRGALTLTRVLWLFALACSAWVGARFARGLGH